MREEVALMLMAVIVWAAFATGMWIHNSRIRRRLQDRLWGMAAAQGVHPERFTDDALLVHRNVGDGRVHELEAQVDQMAQQIDRIVESQEFLSRVLTDRIDQIPDSRLRTPH